MKPVVFEPTISAGKRLQNHALDRMASETGIQKIIITEIGYNHFNDYVKPLKPNGL
jgi:hypothetical protein